MKRIILAFAVIGSGLAVSGCVPVAVGAGAAIGADTIAEDNGGNLF